MVLDEDQAFSEIDKHINSSDWIDEYHSEGEETTETQD
jgi:hypothetical protein